MLKLSTHIYVAIVRNTDKRKGPRIVIADSITSSFFEYGMVVSELVGFVSFRTRPARLRTEKRKKEEKKGKENKNILRVYMTR